MISRLIVRRSRSIVFLWILRKNARQCARQCLGAWLLGCFLVCGLSQTGLAQSDGEAVINREYPLKALFLYNFASYIEWPPAAFAGVDQPFVIGILGSAPLDSMLRDIAATKTINGRRLVVEHFSAPDAVRPCQILFIGRHVPPEERQRVVETLQNQSVLIVGESAGFARRGAAVNFFVENNKIRFEINVNAARQHALKISSKLLALAKIVE